jgi:signal peptidase I
MNTNGLYEDEPTGAQKTVQFIWDLLKVVVISLAIIIPVRYFLIQPFYVKGASMEPSFYDHEYLIIDEISYRFAEPSRGDIIVFKYPKDPSQFFIKRIIGLPGDLVEIKDSQVYIDPADADVFMLAEETYLGAAAQTSGNKSWKLDEGEYYVLGDNRDYSLDSRGFGPVYEDLIIGKVWLRGWPIWRAKVFPSVNYNLAN